ncbi:MAG: transporter substrate-binding domain-containing protein [Betaproteobacteria bacterium]|nr:transporter substrate-binding domain-containing protein [Betaproteobacteria bacterium]
MSTQRRSWIGLTAGALLAVLVAGCASSPSSSSAPSAAIPSAAIRQALAPSGSLRIGVYAGSPSSIVRNAKGETVGVAHDLGHALAARLGVPAKVVEFERLALVVDAVKTGAVDFTFTNASEARAKVVSFTPPLIQLELGYLVPPNSAIRGVNEVDKPGVRVGVSQGSSSQAALGKSLTQAKLVAADSVKKAQDMLRQGEIQTFATNKAILNEMAQGLPGFQVLDGRWGLENLAIAVPQGRDVGMDYLRQFARDVQTSGELQAIIRKADLRGTVQAP